MAQETDTARWDRKPWAGTIDQLMRAAKLVAGRVADAAPYPVGYDPEDREHPFDAEKHTEWLDAESARKVQIVIIEDGGFTRALTAIDDLVEIPADHLGQVGVIGIEIGGNGYVAPSVSISVSRRDGLETRICGRNRTWTAGLRHELQDSLEPPEHLRPPGFKNTEVISGGAAIAFMPLWLGIGLLSKGTTDWAYGLRIGLALAIALLISGSVVFLAFKLPNVELLASGQRPKYQRWRIRIVTVAVALVVGIAGSIIAAVLSR